MVVIQGREAEPEIDQGREAERKILDIVIGIMMMVIEKRRKTEIEVEVDTNTREAGQDLDQELVIGNFVGLSAV